MTTDIVTSKNSKKKAAALFAVIVLVWLVFDRLTKAYFEGAYELGQAGTNCGLFRFTLVHNTGAAWGMFGNSTFALGITSSITCVLIVLVFAFWEKLAGHAPNALETIALALVCSGGLGNGYRPLQSALRCRLHRFHVHRLPGIQCCRYWRDLRFRIACYRVFARDA